ncbi:hypothetical protein O181_096218 [Austropuccinia psidii MF-1]|uniref:DUF4939 domain-containing protein n=1 Tax=Austropuccinia psidii MF-1 TaxID=1389203 RepID=A0A9Q3PBZ6_9BASI|nr:hypothetical protein [Austropuccinia psidii MF-1]
MKAPLDGTPEVPQLRAQLDRGAHLEETAPSRKEGRGPRRSNSFSGVVGGFSGALRTTFKGPGEYGEEEEENSVEEEASDGTEGAPAPLGASQANIQEASSSEASRPPDFKTPSVKGPECFNGTQPFTFRSLIQSCQLIFHNDLANFSQDRKKVLYSTLFLIGRAAKWIETYLSNLTNQDPN